MFTKAAAIYSLVVGFSMIAMWFMFYLTGSIPELETEPARIMMHLAAEFATAVALLAAGWGLLTGKPWGRRVYLLAAGALFYTLIQSPGYFIHQGETGLALMFAVLIVFAVILTIKIIRQD